MNKLQPHITFSKETKQYLVGEIFSNYKKIDLVKKTYIPQRNELLISLVKNKKVLHFGCCDHVELIDKKINEGTHLHSNISKVAGLCYGVDIDTMALKK